MTIIKRADLGRPLTWDELDNNFAQVDSLVTTASTAVETATTQAQAASGFANAASQSSQDAQTAAASAGSAAEAAVADVQAQVSSMAPIRQWSQRIAVGNNALGSMSTSVTGSQALIAIGQNSMASATTANGGIAIGDYTMANATIIPYQSVAIGYRALRDVTPDDASLSQINGGRNTAIGGLCMTFTTTGYQNAMVGRNTGSCISTGYQNSAIGVGALGGYAPVGLSGSIENMAPITTNSSSAIGWNALSYCQSGTENTGLGSRALRYLKKGAFNTAVGSGALINAEVDAAINGNLYTSTTALSSTYSQSGTTITITTPSAHGAVVGGAIEVYFTSGDIFTSYTSDQILANVVSVPSTTTLTITSSVSLTTSGNCTVVSIIGTTAGPVLQQNTAVGRNAGLAMRSGQGSVFIGYQAAPQITTATNSVFIGRFAANANVDGSSNTAYGTNVIALGAGSAVSGNNQLQLGDTAVTVYAQAAVQVRSDERDKADIQDGLGSDFILGLQPKQYKWNYRQDYIQVEEGEDESPVITILENDGSKTRTRFHQGFIAQEVKSLADKLGVDFGGFQDHLVNGGDDVKTLAYEEFIPPMVKTIQKCWSRIDDLEERIKSLEAK